MKKCDVTDADGESIKEVNGDWKLTSDKLDAEEVVEKEDNDLLDSVSTSSIHSPSEVKFKKKFKQNKIALINSLKNYLL